LIPALEFDPLLGFVLVAAVDAVVAALVALPLLTR
jgi:hypothetical protein